MTEVERNTLRDQLRAGDPYDGTDMPAADVDRVRAALRAAGEPPSVRWMPLAAAAAGAVLALAVWTVSNTESTRVVPNLDGEPTTPAMASPDRRAPDSVAAEPAPSVLGTAEREGVVDDRVAAAGDVAGAATPAAPRRAADTEVAGGEARVAGLTPLADDGGAAPEPAAVDIPAVGTRAATTTSPAPRNVRFTAPRGTRIIWTLDPAFESRTESSTARPTRDQQGADAR
jgi:hypothetical protein